MGMVDGRVVLTVGVSLWSAEAFAQAPPSAAFPSDSATSPPAAAPSAPGSPATPLPAPATESSAPTRAAPPTPAPAAIAPVAAPAPRTALVAATADPEQSQEAEEPAAAKERSPVLSLTMSPLHLLSPIFEAHVELKVVPHFGVRLIGGAGSVALESSDPSIDGTRFAGYELGLQAVAYPLREFGSLQLGAEVLYVHVSTEEINGLDIRADGAGVAIGPFLGYKLITSGGFTFVAQGGFQYVTARGEASDNAGNNAEAEDATVIPLLNLDIGWSI